MECNQCYIKGNLEDFIDELGKNLYVYAIPTNYAIDDVIKKLKEIVNEV